MCHFCNLCNLFQFYSLIINDLRKVQIYTDLPKLQATFVTLFVNRFLEKIQTGSYK